MSILPLFTPPHINPKMLP